MAAATGDEEQGEQVFAEEVSGVKECLISGKMKSNKQAQQRYRKTGP